MVHIEPEEISSQDNSFATNLHLLPAITTVSSPAPDPDTASLPVIPSAHLGTIDKYNGCWMYPSDHTDVCYIQDGILHWLLSDKDFEYKFPPESLNCNEKGELMLSQDGETFTARLIDNHLVWSDGHKWQLSTIDKYNGCWMRVSDPTATGYIQDGILHCVIYADWWVKEKFACCGVKLNEKGELTLNIEGTTFTARLFDNHVVWGDGTQWQRDTEFDKTIAYLVSWKKDGEPMPAIYFCARQLLCQGGWIPIASGKAEMKLFAFWIHKWSAVCNLGRCLKIILGWAFSIMGCMLEAFPYLIWAVGNLIHAVAVYMSLWGSKLRAFGSQLRSCSVQNVCEGPGGLALHSGEQVAVPVRYNGASQCEATSGNMTSQNGLTKDSRRCELCQEYVERKKFKRHQKQCPFRSVQCQYCGTRYAACELQVHMETDCEWAPQSCQLCGVSSSRQEMSSHLADECPLRAVSCPKSAQGCDWRNAWCELEMHELLCPYKLEVCPWCWEEMAQYKMKGHVCLQVQADDTCSVCMESFSTLGRHGIPPSILFLDQRRSCRHVHTCQKCAMSWKLKEAYKQQDNALCPECRGPYNAVEALPPHLLVPFAAHGAKREPYKDACRFLPPQQKMRPGTTWWISPFDIYFTSDSISEHFQPSKKEGVTQMRLSILENIRELVHGLKQACEVDIIKVTWFRNRLYVAGTHNCHLCVYLLLAIFYGDDFGLVKVQVEDIDKKKFAEALTTKCDGKWVVVRPNRRVGRTREEVEWPEVQELLSSRSAKNTSRLDALSGTASNYSPRQ